MAIVVVCTKCRARFQVSEKFAGRTGPCPKCKAEIKVPEKQDEVVVHAPESFGPKDAQGRETLKPIFREEAKWSPVAAGIIAGAVVVAFAVAFALKGVAVHEETNQRTEAVEYVYGDRVVMAIGALLVAVPLAYGTYAFVRSSETEPFRGSELWIRTGICGVAYAAVWAVLWLVGLFLFGGGSLNAIQMTIAIIAMLGMGGGIAHLSLDLEYGSGLLHYGLYLLVTVLLRMTMDLSAV